MVRGCITRLRWRRSLADAADALDRRAGSVSDGGARPIEEITAPDEPEA
jgi:hypothetical protein